VLAEEDKQWISERLEKVGTTLLTEFHKRASPVELRQKSHATALRELDAEVEFLSDRLKNLEGADRFLAAVAPFRRERERTSHPALLEISNYS
jgi:hypothetical protein